MFYSLINLWNIFFFVTIFLFVYIIIYFKFIGKLNELSWKLFYGFVSWLSLFIYFFIESETLLVFFTQKIGDAIVLKDLQDLVNLSLDIAYIYSFWFALPVFVFLYYSYVSNYWRTYENYNLRIFLLLFFYFMIISKVLLDWDLFLTSWEFFNKTTKVAYDFQPDFIYIIGSYIGDFYDLTIAFFVFYLFFVVINYFPFNFYRFYLKKTFIILRLILVIFIAAMFFYFWGGESISRDFFIIGFTFISFEMYYFFFIFLMILKRKIL